MRSALQHDGEASFGFICSTVVTWGVPTVMTVVVMHGRDIASDSRLHYYIPGHVRGASLLFRKYPSARRRSVEVVRLQNLIVAYFRFG
jgi:hypothetical protein